MPAQLLTLPSPGAAPLQQVLFVPGSAFIPADCDHRVEKNPPLVKTPYIRAAYSTGR
jgi:hypothetical protein